MGEADEGGGVDDEDGGKESGDVEGVGVAVSGVFRVGEQPQMDLGEREVSFGVGGSSCPGLVGVVPLDLGSDRAGKNDGCIDGCRLNMIDACIDVRGWDTPKVILKFFAILSVGRSRVPISALPRFMGHMEVSGKYLGRLAASKSQKRSVDFPPKKPCEATRAPGKAAQPISSSVHSC